MSKKSASKSQKAPQSSDTEASARARLSQSDVPRFSLAQAVRVARVIEQYGGTPIRPLRVAEGLELSTASSGFRGLCGSAIAYGLTEGGYNAAQISLTPLGRRVVAPTEEGADAIALREACLKPQVINNFLRRYNGHKLPSDTIARNVLRDLGVPHDRTERTLAIIVENARFVGFIREIKGQPYIDIDTPEAVNNVPAAAVEVDDHPDDDKTMSLPGEASPSAPPSREAAPAVAQAGRPLEENDRVFITHGKNKDIVAQLKELLPLARFEPVVSVEKETVSKPVPDKVMDDMRSCFAAIIHVGKEMRVLDGDGNEHVILNPNVLIEIGAAMALYGRRFILLVEVGVTLPSNLQGLYEVRYEGEKLDYEASMKLLRAFKDFKS